MGMEHLGRGDFGGLKAILPSVSMGTNPGHFLCVSHCVCLDYGVRTPLRTAVNRSILYNFCVHVRMSYVCTI